MEFDRGDRELLQKRGSFVIRQLCALLTSDKIIRSIAGLLIDTIDQYHLY